MGKGSDTVKVEYERSVRHTWMILETDEIYEEDYQMRMLQENAVPGLLEVQGQGKDEKSRYRYEVSGKSSLKLLKKKEKLGYKMIETFMRQFIQVLYEVNNYLLDVNCLSLDAAHIFWQDGQFYFCYCPGLKGNIWDNFHILTEYFVREADYEDKEGIYLAYELHKASMEENYDIERALEMILERKEMELKRVEPEQKEKAYDIEEDMILDDWAGEQEIKGNAVRERSGVWEYVSRRIHKRKQEIWEEWEREDE